MQLDEDVKTNEIIENDKESYWPSVETAEARKALSLLRYKFVVEHNISEEEMEREKVRL